MFERYTEKARRVISFARNEAAEVGVLSIETEHVLLGLICENKEVAKHIENGGDSAEAIRSRIQKQRPVGKKIPSSVGLPLSQESRRVLAYAAEEAGRLPQAHWN